MKNKIVKPTSYNITKGDNHPDIMREKIKELEERIEELERDNYKLNLELNTIICKKEGMKIESLPDEPKYKVGDYVEYNGLLETRAKGYITEISDNCHFYIDNGNYGFLEKDIVGYAKPDLLTPEEKEFLKALVKFYRNVKYIKTDTDVLWLRDTENSYITCIRVEDKFYNLEMGHDYTLEELGL